MQPFITHTGIAAPLLRDNIDTDQIIPSREMKTVSKKGLGGALFAGQRYIKDRDLNPEFILNQTDFKSATILLSGQNFGCGSSREHAVWALKDYGFRAIIAESFGEIFYNNCIRNGILCASLDKAKIAQLGSSVAINLVNQTVDSFKFDIPVGDKETLLEGLDAITQTLKHKSEITAFFERDKAKRSWAWR